MTSQLSVCVIGAGAAGLCAARHLAHRTNNAGERFFVPTIFERSDSLGGTWVYTPKVGRGVHSSMYENLKTNLPKEVMAFQDFPFTESKHSYLTHQEVKKYLEDYADHFQLRSLINFNTEVKSVIARSDPGSKTTWEVEIERNGEKSTREYDSVIVCSGHYANPIRPDLPGLEMFGGFQMHSHEYRKPDTFDGKVVAVLGAASSGQDIGLEITSTAEKVFLCHNMPPNKSKLPDNMEQVAGIKSCTGESSFELTDGSSIEGVDSVLYCTGYRYDYPFLDGSSKVEVTDHVVGPLFKHFINIREPSLCIIGIPTHVCPFPLFNLQCALFAKFLSGEASLPDETGMMEDFEKSYEEHLSSGKPPRHFHKMGFSQWDYNRELAKLADEPEIPRRVEKLYEDVWNLRRTHLTLYKGESYHLEGDVFVSCR